MAKKNSLSNNITRRSILRKSAIGASVGTSVGMTSLSQIAAAWETADTDDLDQLRDAPEVIAILRELGYERLPSDGETRTQSIDGHGKMTSTKVGFEFGTLYFGELNEKRNAMFLFEDITHRMVPSKYKGVPAGTRPILTVTDGNVLLRRMASEYEREAALSVITETGERASVSTETGLNGFYVTITKHINEPKKFEIQRHVVTFNEEEVYPALEGSRTKLVSGSGLSVQAQIETRGIASQLIKDYITGLLASNLGDELHECGSIHSDPIRSIFFCLHDE